ncbi:hypothetical protein ACN082_03160 [Rothia sp. CCM 9417]|uniref:hypothetical protein n=1 Tax=Rothia sp. CCM 9417 TaxID=3402657 RepID=UPI003ADA2BCE
MLDKAQYARIKEAVTAANKIPFIDDIEDYIWESIWAYSQGLENPPRDRKKLLFDVVDTSNKIGWSAKTLVWPKNSGSCEFVIQRADVIKKKELLGFPHLSIEESEPQEIGNAILKHWIQKIEIDMTIQNVEEPRLALLLKSKDRKIIYPYEEEIIIPKYEDITWSWTSPTKTSLQGRNYAGKIRYRWYKNQKQLFESFDLSDTAYPIEVTQQIFDVSNLINLLTPTKLK